MEMSVINLPMHKNEAHIFRVAEEIAKRRFDQAMPLDRLTSRETEVLHLLSKGLTIGEICEIFGTAQSTVRSQLQSIFQKLNVSSALQAVVYASRHGFLEKSFDESL